MSALTATSWTVAYANTNRYNSTSILGRKRYVNLKLTLTTGESPLTGVPLPVFGNLGMVRYLENVILHNDIATTVFSTARGRAQKWVYSVTGKSIKPFQAILSSGTATSASGGRSLRATATTLSITGAKVFYVTAIGW